MHIIRALATITLSLLAEPLIEFGTRFVVALLGVDVLGALSQLARGLD